jgi:hypothetical protein
MRSERLADFVRTVGSVATAVCLVALFAFFFNPGRFNQFPASTASAGNGGVATASANGGAVSVGDVNSGANRGNTITVGNTSG